MPSTARRVSPILAGRVTELRRLDEALTEAVNGGVQRTVLLGAEAGGGKSRLIREFTGRLGGRAAVLAGRCVPQFEAGLPYAPFTAALRELARSRGPAAVAGLGGDGAAAHLASILPEFGPPATGLDPELARARLFEVVRTLLASLARSQPTVLVIEDAHWADGATRDLLSFLAGNPPNGPFLVIVSYRTEELHRAHPLRPLLAELWRLGNVIELTLGRMSRLDVAGQLEGILGQPPSADILEEVWRRGGGVPLFTEMLLDRNGHVRSELPGSLRDLLLSVTRELSAETRSILHAMAVGGVRVGHELLARVTGMPSSALTPGLRPAVDGHVLVCDADGYAFRHALIQEAVRADLLSGEAAQFHRAYAGVLEVAPELAPEAWVSLALARHWRAAREHDRALRAAWNAAQEAAERLAYPELLEMLQLVLDLWAFVPSAADQLGHDRIHVLERAADAACWAAEPERGLALVGAALAERDPERDGVEIAAMLLQRAVMRQQQMLPGELDDLRAALRLCPGPTRLRAESLGQLVRALVRHGHAVQARRPARELELLAVELGDEEYRLEAAIVRARLGVDSGQDAVSVLHAAIDAARGDGWGRLEIIAYAALQEVLERSGEFARAIEVGRNAVARTRLVGQARYMGATVAHHLARSLESAGRWVEAVEALDAAVEMNPAPSGRAQVLQVRASIAIARGETEMAARMMGELRAFFSGGLEPPMLLLEIQHRLAGGDPMGAEDAAMALPQCLGADPHVLWPLASAALRAHADSGRLPRLREAVGEIASRLSRTGRVEEAHALTFEAELSRASGHPDPAKWDAASDAWKALGSIHQESYASMRAAVAVATLGDRAGAGERLQHAVALASTLGAAPLLSQLASLAGRIGMELGPATSRVVAPTAPALTDREVTVLRLVAAGRSNREIAAELFISPKTASVHVSNILGKLNVGTRAAAAAAAYRLHLFEPS